MSILITGGAGFIGRHTAKLFHGTGIRVVILDNFMTRGLDDTRWGCVVRGEISDTAVVRGVLREHAVSAVIHLAASTRVSDSMAQPASYFTNNVCGTFALLDAMKAEGVKRLVFASSSSVYGNAALVAAQENETGVPINPYGESKLAIERALPWYERAYGLQWVALRYFNVAGAEENLGEDPAHSMRIIPRAVHAATGGGPSVDIFGTTYATGDGSAVRDYVHVSDIAQANLQALRYLERGGTGTVMNIGSGTGFSVLQIVAEVSSQSRRPIPFFARAARPGDPGCVISNPSKARSLLGWVPMNSDLSFIISSTIHSCTGGAALLPPPVNHEIDQAAF